MPRNIGFGLQVDRIKFEKVENRPSKSDHEKYSVSRDRMNAARRACGRPLKAFRKPLTIIILALFALFICGLFVVSQMRKDTPYTTGLEDNEQMLQSSLNSARRSHQKFSGATGLSGEKLAGLKLAGLKLAGEYQSEEKLRPGVKGGEEIVEGDEDTEDEVRDDEAEETPQICRYPVPSLKGDDSRYTHRRLPPLDCTGQPSELFYVSRGDGELRLNETALDGATLTRCEYDVIEWGQNDFEYAVAKTYIRTTEPFAIARLRHDFVRIRCYLNSEDESGMAEGSQNSRRKKKNRSKSQWCKLTETAGNIDEKKERNLEPKYNPPEDKLAALEKQGLDKETLSVSKARESQPGEISDDNVDQTVQRDDPLPAAKHTRRLKTIEGSQEVHYADNTERNLTCDRMRSAEEGRAKEAPPHFTQYLAQASPTEEALSRVAEQIPFPKSLQMNVLIFSLQSMSRLGFERILPKTYAFLTDVLGAIILDGYNGFGDSSTSAFLPLLTGKRERELPESRKNRERTNFVDHYPFIWNRFEQSGYVTLYADDQPEFGTFQHRLNGFERPPVDHYMRPFWLAAEPSQLHVNSAPYCLGTRPQHRYTLDYVRQVFLRYPKSIPRFAFAVLGDLTRADGGSPAGYMDADLMDLLETLRRAKALENTVLILMTDRGPHYDAMPPTTEDRLEKRLPLASFVFPRTFEERFPEAIKNLRRNSGSLTTPLDIHETLYHLLDFDYDTISAAASHSHGGKVRNGPEKGPGLSLLTELPLNRTCTSAGINLQFCTCAVFETANVEEKLIKLASNAILESINILMTEVRELCEPLSVNDILDAKLIVPVEKVRQTQSKKVDVYQQIANLSRLAVEDILHYQLVVETHPNGGKYEATVQYRPAEERFQITDDINRVDDYDQQAKCIEKTNPDLQKFCHCKV